MDTPFSQPAQLLLIELRVLDELRLFDDLRSIYILFT